MDTLFLGAVDRASLNVEAPIIISDQEADALYSADYAALMEEIAIVGAIFDNSSIFLRRLLRTKLERPTILSADTSRFEQYVSARKKSVYVMLTTKDPRQIGSEILSLGSRLTANYPDVQVFSHK